MFCFRYDLNLIKKKLAKHLNLDTEEYSFVVKKSNSYVCISTPELKFLDASQFVAPGCSYDAFLSNYDAPAQKGYFCYEWLTDFDKLSETELPPIEAFYSSLKGFNVLESASRREFERLEADGCSQEEALQRLQLQEVPDSKEKVYQSQQRLWHHKKMKTMLDYLKHYNNLDTVPFVHAIEHMMSFYREKGVDLFKNAISVPGVARSLIFRAAGPRTSFALMDKRDEDLYLKIKANIVGTSALQYYSTIVLCAMHSVYHM